MEIPAQEARDTLNFMNGDMIRVRVLDTAFGRIKCFPPARKNKKEKETYFETERIYSIKYGTGREVIMYRYDTLAGNIFTEYEARMFVLGEREAMKNFSSPSSFLTGFAAGVASPILLTNAQILAPIPPFAISLAVLYPKVVVNTKKIQDKSLLIYDTYILGYERVARNKKIISALKGAATGLLVGFAVSYIIDK